MASSAALTTTHLPRLRTLLQEWEKKQLAPKGFVTPIKKGCEDLSNDSADGLQDNIRRDNRSRQSKDVIVAFRTRPPLENEAADKFKGNPDQTAESGQGGTEAVKELEVEFCAGISVPNAEPGVFVAHVPGMKWSGPTLAHKSYDADLAFGPDVSNEEAYQRTIIAQDLLPLVLSGGIGCVLAYGQTGSGKTFTMEGLEHRIARDLFDTAKSTGKRLLSSEKDGGADGSDVFKFSVTFLELLGKYATDLVDPSTKIDAQGNPVRKEVPIREDKVGNVKPGLVSTSINNSAELENLITNSLAHRRTSATNRNAASSRSHALLTIRVKNTLLPYAEEGQLILVDLAGSERYEDSKAHDKSRMDESKENNMSLMNLKECVQAKANTAQEDGFVHIPWRSNKLTMLLKPIFDIESRQPSKTVIIAHVSPHIQDTIHSTNTLSYTSSFKIAPPKLRGPAPYDANDPRTWDHEHTVSWLTEQFKMKVMAADTKDAEIRNLVLEPLDNGAHVDLPVDIGILCPPGATGMFFGKMYTIDFVERCLNAIPKPAEGIPEVDTEVVKNMAQEIIGALFYLVITAKTKSRKELMNSRKKLNVEHSYGEGAQRFVPGTNRTYQVEVYDHADTYDARIYYGEEWDKTINDAIQKSKDEGGWVVEAKGNAIKGLMEKWKAQKAEKETKTG